MDRLHKPGLATARAVCVAVLLACSSSLTALPQVDPWSQCRPAGALLRLAGLPEASGLAVSRQTPGRFWSHNDSGQPELFALDTAGIVTARVRLAGAAVQDWEAVAAAPCQGGACLFIGDIGDNTATRHQISIYRIAEPAAAAPASISSEVFHATYPDGAHDAETVLATPDGGLFIVTKGDTGSVALYRFPLPLRAGTTVALERVGKLRGGGKDRITDGAVSPDGAWVVLRTKTALIIYAAKEFFAGSWREARRIDLTALGEPQGEGVAIGSDATIYVAGEGPKAGTLGRVVCG